MADSALVLIEFQREWLDPEIGKLNSLMEDRDQFAAAVQGARRALIAARDDATMLVIHCPLIVSPGYPELGPARTGLRAAIQKAGTWLGPAGDFAPEFEPVDHEPIVAGRAGASGFASSNLDALLRRHGVRRVYLTGFALHVCVESTLREGHDLGYEMVVLDDATAAFTAPQKEHVLTHVVHHYGTHISVNQFLRQLSEPGAQYVGHDG
jgi:nicotinamidase-related amidase